MATKNMAVVVCAKCKHRNYIHPAKLLRAIKSDVRAKACAENGKKGGRPKGSGKKPVAATATIAATKINVQKQLL
jgi:hypothetical protein